MDKIELRIAEVQVRHLISTSVKGCYGYICLTPTGYEALAYTPASSGATHVKGLASHGDGLNVIHDAVTAYLLSRATLDNQPRCPNCKQVELFGHPHVDPTTKMYTCTNQGLRNLIAELPVRGLDNG